MQNFGDKHDNETHCWEKRNYVILLEVNLVVALAIKHKWLSVLRQNFQD